MKAPKLNALQWLLLGTIMAIACLALVWGWKFGESTLSESTTSWQKSASLNNKTKLQAETPTKSDSPGKAGYDQMLAALDKSWKQLRQGMTPDQAQKLIEEMTTMLWTGDPTQVGAGIRAFLESGQDASTGLPFRVGEESLALSPSLRVALLDLLERLDFGEAADYAEVIVGRMEQPDEVAVALRTLMHVPDDDPRRQLAITGVDRLLQRADWKAKPSGGYL